MQGFALLLLLLPAAIADLPFYCRFRKPNCDLRPNTKCCPPVAEATTLPPPTTTILPDDPASTVVSQQDLPDDAETEEEVNETVQNAKRNEDLQAQPSQIREVIVEPPEINQIPTTSERPEKYAPRFCLVLKYNCKSRSSHPCCRHPLPPRNPLPGSAPARSSPNKVRPTRKSIPQRPSLRRGGTSGEDGEVTTQRSRRPRPTLRTPPTTPATPKSSGTPRRSSLRRPRPPRPTWQTTPRPRPRPRPTRQRPRFGSGKSPVCRIINCKRNPAHKCCREPTTTTTTTEAQQDTTLDALLTSTTPVSVTEPVDVGEVGDVVVSHIASVSSVETRLVAATSPRRKNPARDEVGEDEDELQLLEESEEEEDEMDTESKEEMAKDNIEEMTTMSYTELESATPQQEDAPSLEMMYETTLKPQASVDNGGSNNGREVNSKTSSQIVDKVFEEKNPELGRTVFHIGGVGDTVFQEIVAVSTLTPPSETVNNFLYEEQEEEEEEEEMLNQGGGLAPIYVEAQSTGTHYDGDAAQVTIVYPTPPGEEREEAPSPVFIPHPVFVPERGEKDRIRQEVEERIVLEEKRLEEEERRRKEEIIRREENAQRLIQEEERRRQEVEYWRRKVQEEEERRRQEEELRLRIKEEEEMEVRKIKEEEERLRREKEVREEFLVPAASSRKARIAVGNLLDTDHLEGRKESVELPPRVRMECFRFDCLSAPSDPCCSRSKRQIQSYNSAPSFKAFEEKPIVQFFDEEEEPSSLQSLHHLPLRRPLLPGWRVEATVTRVEKSVHWGE